MRPKIEGNMMPTDTTNRQIPGCGTHHIALQTRDWDASLRLYRDILGMQVVAEFGPPERRIFLLDIGDGSHMELFAPLAAAADQPVAAELIPHIALATTDTRLATERVQDALSVTGAFGARTVSLSLGLRSVAGRVGPCQYQLTFDRAAYVGWVGCGGRPETVRLSIPATLAARSDAEIAALMTPLLVL
jgi:hypothetical protein